jgi:hypothetical protein
VRSVSPSTQGDLWCSLPSTGRDCLIVIGTHRWHLEVGGVRAEGGGGGWGEGEVTLYERRGSRFWRSAGEALAFGEHSAKGLHRFTMLHVTRRIRNCSPFSFLAFIFGLLTRPRLQGVPVPHLSSLAGVLTFDPRSSPPQRPLLLRHHSTARSLPARGCESRAAPPPRMQGPHRPAR